MHRTLLRTLTLALIAAPVLTIAFGVGAIGRGADPAFAPLPTVQARTITITIPLQTARPLSAAPGLRFTRFDADGCATLTHTVYRAEGGRQQTSELFCRH
jgi:hypothetical protein